MRDPIGGDGGAERDGESPPSTPTWVKLFGIAVLVLVLVLVAMMLIGGVRHGPGLHDPASGAGPGSVASSV